MDKREFSTGNLTLNIDEQLLAGPEREFKLNRTEAELLGLFMNHQEEVLSRAYLMRNVWKTEYLGDTRTLDVHVSWLRNKLKACDTDHPKIRAVRGIGYLFVTAPLRA